MKKQAAGGKDPVSPKSGGDKSPTSSKSLQSRPSSPALAVPPPVVHQPLSNQFDEGTYASREKAWLQGVGIEVGDDSELTISSALMSAAHQTGGPTREAAGS